MTKHDQRLDGYPLPQLTRIDRTACKALQTATQAALDAVGEAFGLTVTVRPGGYTSSSYAPRVTFSTASAATDLWATVAGAYNLPPLGTVVDVLGVSYRLTGWNEKASRTPIEVERVRDGKAFRIPVAAVRHGSTPHVYRGDAPCAPGCSCGDCERSNGPRR